MVCNCCGGKAWEPLFEENRYRLGRCPDCDLLYIENMPSAEIRMTEMEGGHFAGTQQVIDAARQRASEQALSAQFERYVALARRHAPSGRWLDIGCGAGGLLASARSAGYEVEGIELTLDRLQATRARGFTVHGEPLENLGLPNESFDVISLINVFSHLTDPARTFAECRRLIRPRGVIVLATGEVGAGVRRHHVPRWNLGDHLYFLGDGTMAVYAERTGLTIEEHQRTWLPNEMYSRAWLATKGGSRLRNTVKATIDKVPGLFPTYRSVMLRRNANNPIHSAVFALGRAGVGDTPHGH